MYVYVCSLYPWITLNPRSMPKVVVPWNDSWKTLCKAIERIC